MDGTDADAIRRAMAAPGALGRGELARLLSLRTAEDRALAVNALEMRLAALSARMAAPKKGDRPELLQAEYMDIAEKLREMKRQ